MKFTSTHTRGPCNHGVQEIVSTTTHTQLSNEAECDSALQNRRDSVYDLADTVPTKEYILLSKRLDESNAEATSLKSQLLTANQQIEDLEKRNKRFHVQWTDREKEVDDTTLNSARYRRERDFCKSDLHTSKMENSKLQAQSDILRSIVTKFSSAYVEARAGQLAAEEALSQAQSTTRRSCFEKAQMEVQTLISRI